MGFGRLVEGFAIEAVGAWVLFGVGGLEIGFKPELNLFYLYRAGQ